jgi:hypothetical protein
MYPQRRVAEWVLGLGLLVTFVVLALSACGAGGGAEGGGGEGVSDACKGKEAAESEQANGAKALPGGLVPLPPGRYVTRDFEPTLSFEVGEGWEILEAGGPTLFSIARGASLDTLYPPYPQALSFLNPPEEVSDPEHPEKLVPAPETPDDWAAWFQEHRYLEADEPKLACFGEAPGKQFDSWVAPLPDDYYSSKCVGRYPPLWSIPGAQYWCGEPGTRSREIVLKVEDEAVIIDITASDGKFDGFVSEARKVIDTVEWRDS